MATFKYARCQGAQTTGVRNKFTGEVSEWHDLQSARRIARQAGLLLQSPALPWGQLDRAECLSIECYVNRERRVMLDIHLNLSALRSFLSLIFHVSWNKKEPAEKG